MFYYLDSTRAIAVNLSIASAKLAMARTAAMDAQSGIAVDGAAGNQYAASIEDQERPLPAVVDDPVVAVDIRLGAAGNLYSRKAIVAEYVLCSRSDAVAAIQNQMAGEDCDPHPPVVGDRGAGDVAIHIKGSAAHTDSRANAVLNCAIEDVNQRIDAGEANTLAVLNRVADEIHARIVIDDSATPPIDREVLNLDPLRGVDGQKVSGRVAWDNGSRWIAGNGEIGASKHHNIFVAGTSDQNGIGARVR